MTDLLLYHVICGVGAPLATQGMTTVSPTTATISNWPLSSITGASSNKGNVYKNKITQTEQKQNRRSDNMQHDEQEELHILTHHTKNAVILYDLIMQRKVE